MEADRVFAKTPPIILAKGQISILRNPDIAHVLYLRGFMEKAGRGSVLIIDECKKSELPVPQWISDPVHGVTLTFFAPQAAPQVTPQATPQVKKLVKVMIETMKREEIQVALGLKDRKNFNDKYLNPALEIGLIEMTIPGKPNSPKQQYRLTKQGKAFLKKLSS